MVKDTSATVLTAVAAAPQTLIGRRGNGAIEVGRVFKGFFTRLKSAAVDDEHPRANDNNPSSSPLSRRRRQMEWQSRSPCCTRPSPHTPNRYISGFRVTTPTPVDSSSIRIYLFPPIAHRFETRRLLSGRGQNVNLFIFEQIDNALPVCKNVNRNFPRQNGIIIGIDILPSTVVHTWKLCRSTRHYVPHTRPLVHKLWYRDADDDCKVHLFLI